MKYIRTKDGIIDLTSKQVSSYEIIDDKTAVDEYCEDSGFIMVYYFNEYIGKFLEYDNKGGRSMNSWYLKDIIDQADTIEELCDEFVNLYSNGIITQYVGNNFKKEAKDTKTICRQENITVVSYGAIWTEKGLIYVAKMNEEGELCLI